MTDKHRAMSEETIRRLLWLVKEKPTNLTAWEIGLINDRFEALKKFETRAVITEKQVYHLNKIFKKAQLPIRLEGLGPIESPETQST